MKLDELFIKEYREKVDADVKKTLKIEIKRIKSKFSPKYSVELLQQDIIRLLLAVQFSEKAISKVLKCPLKLVKSLVKKD